MKRKNDPMQMMVIGFCMQLHFGPCDDGKIETCSDCRDFLSGVCPGKNLSGVECWRCMEHKVKSGQFQMGGSF